MIFLTCCYCYHCCRFVSLLVVCLFFFLSSFRCTLLDHNANRWTMFLMYAKIIDRFTHTQRTKYDSSFFFSCFICARFWLYFWRWWQVIFNSQLLLIFFLVALCVSVSCSVFFFFFTDSHYVCWKSVLFVEYIQTHVCEQTFPNLCVSMTILFDMCALHSHLSRTTIYWHWLSLGCIR